VDQIVLILIGICIGLAFPSIYIFLQKQQVSRKLESATSQVHIKEQEVISIQKVVTLLDHNCEGKRKKKENLTSFLPVN
jgi:type II secretory pathway pseudopilin PulG